MPGIAGEDEQGPTLAEGRDTCLFGRAAILRSLLLFNAMFAVQTLLDIVYLWGGPALPDGMTTLDMPIAAPIP